VALSAREDKGVSRQPAEINARLNTIGIGRSDVCRQRLDMPHPVNQGAPLGPDLVARPLGIFFRLLRNGGANIAFVLRRESGLRARAGG
jgi:hypothetical protein